MNNDYESRATDSPKTAQISIENKYAENNSGKYTVRAQINLKSICK